MGLDLFSGRLLIVDKVGKINCLAALWYAEGLKSLHLVQSLVDIHEAGQESWSSLNEVTSQGLSGAVVHPEPDVAFPESKDFAYDVVLEELHAC